MTDERERNPSESEQDDVEARKGGPVTVQEGDGPEIEAESGSTEVHELREELDALNDRHLRLAAEFDNYRKRNDRERQAVATRLQAELIASILDVLDDLQRVEESATEGTKESLLEGFRLVERKLLSVLEASGLQPVDAEGKRFDPEHMEALMAVPTDDPARDGHVADVFQRGYLFRDALLRPARVRVLQYEEPAGDTE